MIGASLTDLIGNTPLVRLNHIIKSDSVTVLGKMEGNNPGGSVKDRAGLNMIEQALKRGDIKSGDKLVEATSGNTGIALAMIANLKGLNMTLLMPEGSSQERIKTMRAYGAEVILTPKEGTIELSRTEAERMVREEGYIMLDQFGNHDNRLAHYKTTGPEIWRDTQGQLTHFVSAMGTTGTISGTSRFLKEQSQEVNIIGCQPTEGGIPGIRRWSPEFVPAIYDDTYIDQIIDVSREEAITMSRRLAEEEGIMCGMSAGGACHVAIQVAQQLKEGVVVFILCDRGDRYLSTDLFE